MISRRTNRPAPARRPVPESRRLPPESAESPLLPSRPDQTTIPTARHRPITSRRMNRTRTHLPRVTVPTTGTSPRIMTSRTQRSSALMPTATITMIVTARTRPRSSPAPRPPRRGHPRSDVADVASSPDSSPWSPSSLSSPGSSWRTCLLRRPSSPVSSPENPSRRSPRNWRTTTSRPSPRKSSTTRCPPERSSAPNPSAVPSSPPSHPSRSSCPRVRRSSRFPSSKA